MKVAKEMTLFSIGGGAYVGLELLYRGFSHISMFAAGGLCFLLIGQLRRAPMSRPARVGCGTGIITAVELATGLLFNRDYQVWDYRSQPGNFLGQVCPQFMALWVPLTVAALALYGWVEPKVDTAVEKLRVGNQHG